MATAQDGAGGVYGERGVPRASAQGWGGGGVRKGPRADVLSGPGSSHTVTWRHTG